MTTTPTNDERHRAADALSSHPLHEGWRAELIERVAQALADQRVRLRSWLPNCSTTATDRAHEPTATFDAHPARWEAAPANENECVEMVARAIAADWCRRWPNDNEPWQFLREEDRNDYRAEAAAAITALRTAGQDSKEEFTS